MAARTTGYQVPRTHCAWRCASIPPNTSFTCPEGGISSTRENTGRAGLVLVSAGVGWLVLSLAGYLLEVGNEAQGPYLGTEEEVARLTVGARQ